MIFFNSFYSRKKEKTMAVLSSWNIRFTWKIYFLKLMLFGENRYVSRFTCFSQLSKLCKCDFPKTLFSDLNRKSVRFNVKYFSEMLVKRFRRDVVQSSNGGSRTIAWNWRIGRIGSERHYAIVGVRD